MPWRRHQRTSSNGSGAQQPIPDALHAPWSGVVVVAFAPVPDERTLREIVDAVAGIRAVSHVALNDIARERARLAVSLSRPTMLAEELQHALTDRVMRCRTDGGSLAVTLHRRGPGATPTVRLFDHVAVAPTFQHLPGAAPSAARSAAAHRLTPTLIDGVLRSITAFSIVVLDSQLAVQALAGPLATEARHSGDVVIGRPLADALSAGMAGPLSAPSRKALRGVVSSTDFALPNVAVPVRAELSPIRGGDEVVGVLIALRELPPARSAMTDFADVFDLVFSRSKIAQALLSPDGRIVRANAAFTDLTGYAHGQLLGIHLRRLSAGDGRPIDADHAARDLFGTSVLTRRDGSTIVVSEHRSWSHDRRGRSRGLAVQLIPRTTTAAPGR